MSIVLYRIDDRLVHGQVMTAWSKVFDTTRILIIDDATANNPFLVQVMKMAVPGDYHVDIVGMADAAAKIAGDPADKRTMVLVKEPKTILELQKQGVEIKELNVGNMGAAPGRRVVNRSLQLTGDEYQTLIDIQSNGTRVYAQIYPDGKTLELNKLKF